MPLKFDSCYKNTFLEGSLAAGSAVWKPLYALP